MAPLNNFKFRLILLFSLLIIHQGLGDVKEKESNEAENTNSKNEYALFHLLISIYLLKFSGENLVWFV